MGAGIAIFIMSVLGFCLTRFFLWINTSSNTSKNIVKCWFLCDHYQELPKVPFWMHIIGLPLCLLAFFCVIVAYCIKSVAFSRAAFYLQLIPLSASYWAIGLALLVRAKGRNNRIWIIMLNIVMAIIGIFGALGFIVSLL